jgi:hypothetical protein
MSAPVIRLHVERLVLEGFDDLHARDAPRLREALQAELTRLLSQGGLSPTLASGGAQPALTGRPLERVPGATPDALGVELARSVYGGLGS